MDDAGENFANTRYSELAEITTANVADLQVAFTFSVGIARGQESAPIVAGTRSISSAPTRTSSTRSTSLGLARH